MSTGTLYRQPERHTYMDVSQGDRHHLAIIRNLIDFFGFAAGDHLVEVGAGSGRYTEMLLNAGLRVTAVEPDPVLYRKCMVRLGERAGFRAVCAGCGALPADLGQVEGLCGFHVLHHFDEATLDLLARDLARLGNSAQARFGWFFLEPNPFNPLYPVQITLNPSMRWSEERGIWSRRRYAMLPWTYRGSCGLFPPQLCRVLPERLLGVGSADLRDWRPPWALYEALGTPRARSIAGAQ